jgi:uncharacterized membrane protein
MIIGIIETLLGLFLLNISIKSLKRSVIRKWKEGFYITMFTGLITIIHGLSLVAFNIPESINTFLLLFISSSMMLALFRISDMKGLQA